MGHNTILLTSNISSGNRQGKYKIWYTWAYIQLIKIKETVVKTCWACFKLQLTFTSAYGKIGWSYVSTALSNWVYFSRNLLWFSSFYLLKLNWHLNKHGRNSWLKFNPRLMLVWHQQPPFWAIDSLIWPLVNKAGTKVYISHMLVPVRN